MSKVLQNPQPSLLCVPVTFHSVPLDQVRSEPIQVPSFLIMEDLPTLDMSQLRCIILMLFNNNGFEVADIKINKDVAYIWFKNDKGSHFHFVNPINLVIVGEFNFQLFSNHEYC